MSTLAIETRLLMPWLAWSMRRHRSPYRIKYRGKTFTIFPDVSSPKYDRSSRLAIDCLPPLIGRRFLEIGSGCGIVSVFAAIAGAGTIVAADISPHAVRNTRFNFDAHGLHDARVIESDLLDGIDGEFDVIVFNAPYYSGSPRDWLERALFDQDYRTLKRFIADVRRCLAPCGSVLLGLPKGNDEAMLQRELQHAGLVIARVEEFGIRGFGGRCFTLRAG
jgi:release factor glutamine methyltransferase